MAKFPLYQWKKAGEGSSSIDTQNFASKIKANTFTQKNVFENTGSVVSIKTTDGQSFGIEFKDNSNDMVGFVGTNTNDNEQKIILSGTLGLQLHTPNKDINVNSGTGHTLANSSKNWNQHVDNSIIRYKDLKYQRKFEYTNVTQPSNSWNYGAWKWQLNSINSNNGLYEFLIVFSFADDKAVTIKSNIVWKSGLTESQSTMVAVEKSGRTFYFQLAIKNDNRLYIYHKHDNQGTSTNISWVRGYILRDNTFPTKMSSVW